jgi:hypothetical protein
MIEALILSQCQDGLVYPEDMPQVLIDHIGHGRLQTWLQNTWHWGTQNASDSDDAKPWSRTRYLDMLCSLYPDAIPF